MDHEGVEVERVVVHHNPTGIANNLIDATSNHAPHEPPGFPPHAQDDVGEHGHGIEGNEDDVGWEGRSIPIDGGFDGAERQCAVAVGPEGDDIGVGFGHCRMILTSRAFKRRRGREIEAGERTRLGRHQIKTRRDAKHKVASSKISSPFLVLDDHEFIFLVRQTFMGRGHEFISISAP